MRVIWTLVLLGVAWWVWRRWSAARDGARRTVDAQPVPPAPLGVARMVRCAHCDVHLPESDALLSQGRHYCSAAHREAAERTA
jgi:uncharacterized protein